MKLKRKNIQKIRKAHRFLGVFLGIQFLFWTISGLYFSWTNLDEIHGDQFKTFIRPSVDKSELIGIQQLNIKEDIHDLELLEIDKTPYFLINSKFLYNAQNGNYKPEISENEAISIAENHMIGDLSIAKIQKINTVDTHHEYRGKPLPAYQISFKGADELKAYVSVKQGRFETLRHRDWRWFDFLWMTHTMDYQTRDNFNNLLLRAFSLLGLITVMSGFLLFAVSSPRVVHYINNQNLKK